MFAKNINKIKEVFTFKNAVDTLEMANNFALATTENVALKGIDAVAKWQKSTDKAIKKGLKKSAKNQNKMFNTLDAGKETLVGKVNDIKKRFVKK